MGKCFYCDNEILAGEGRIVPLDRPYVNLWVHRLCADSLDNEYLKANLERIYEYIGKPKEFKTKRKQ